MTANKWPVRATRSARIGSFSGTVVFTGPLLVEASEGESNKSYSTDLMPGVWGKGVIGVGGWMSWLEAESAVRREALSALSAASSGTLSETPSWETTRLELAVWLLLVAYTRGVPTGQYMAGCVEPRGRMSVHSCQFDTERKFARVTRNHYRRLAHIGRYVCVCKCAGMKICSPIVVVCFSLSLSRIGRPWHVVMMAQA